MNNVIRTICGILGIILTAISIIASSGYILNESNRVQNKSIQNSATYKQMEQGKVIQNDLYMTKKDELKRLQALQEQQKSDGTNIVNNSSVKNKAGRGIDVQNKIAGTQQQINQIQNELTALTSELQKPIDTKNVNFKAENGYIALFQLLADKLNVLESFKDSPTTADRLLTYFLMFISAVFEILAVVLYIIDKKVLSAIAFVISFAFTCFLMVSMAFGIVACILAGLMAFVMDFSKVVMLKIAFDGNIKISQSLSGTNFKAPIKNENGLQKQPLFKFKPKTLGATAKQDKNQIGFKATIPYPDFKNSDIEKYKKYMYETQKDNVSKGYMHIAKNINMSAETARKIKAHLEHEGIIKTNGAKTEILK